MREFTDDFCAKLADHLEQTNDELARCHRLPDGSIDDPEVAAEVELVAGWIEQIRSAPTSTGDHK